MLVLLKLRFWLQLGSLLGHYYVVVVHLKHVLVTWLKLNCRDSVATISGCGKT